MQSKTEYDSKGRIIYEERLDGFWERTTYYDFSGVKIVETHYPNGITETERFVNMEGMD